jgi:cell division protease FtsH
MVTEYGMSSKLGAVKYGTSESEPFLGRDYGHQRDYSEDIAADIDGEVRELIEGAHDEAWEILVQYRDVLDAMVLELVEKETLNKDDLERILSPVRKRPPHNTFTAFGKRTPSDRPPIEIPPSLRKPAPTARAANGNGSGNGSSPAPAPGPGGEVPVQPGAFGPQPGPAAPPYGGAPPPPYGTYPPPPPAGGGQG